MSFISNEYNEQIITDASKQNLVNVLIEYGYEVTETRLQITAIKKSFWLSKASVITIIEKDGLRYCTNNETSQGWAISPNKGVLATIVKAAESREEY